MIGPTIGYVLRVHEGDASHDIGKVVEVEKALPGHDEKDQRFWYIEFPEINSRLKGKSKRHYLKEPVVASVAVARERVDAGQLSFIEFKYPSEYYLTDEQLASQRSTVGLSRKSRRDLTKWKAKRDKHHEMLKPLIAKHGDLRALLHDDKAGKTVLAKRATELHHKDAKLVTAVFRRWLLGGCVTNALLPDFSNQGQPGTEKFCSIKTGRPTGKQPGYVHTEADRKKLRAGWRRFKKEGVSVHDAYVLTMKEYWPKSVRWITSTKVEVELLDAHLRPTEAEFAFHGPNGDPEASAWRINLGQNNFLRNHRGLPGTSRDRIFAVGQLGVIDATSEDQRPVSRSSRLLSLPSSWRTMIVDAGLNYIFGVYRGFEKGGALPALMAIEHAATGKVRWAKEKLDIDLEPGEWYDIVFGRVRGDSGDLKNENGIAALTSAEISAEFTRSYAAEHKIVEATHHIIHRTADHLATGTTRGKLLERGQKAGESSLTMWETWPSVIQAITRHNNEDPVPHLLTLEMRNANVGATRREILEFMRREGYVRSEPYDLDLLRAQCLPKLSGSIKADGIHVFDPRTGRPNSRYIPELIYDADWLHRDGWTSRGRRSPIPVSIHLNPAFLTEAWINVGGMKRLALRHDDPEMNEVPLADWLAISDRDDLMMFLSRSARDSSDASRVASAQAVNAQATEQKRAEEIQAGGPAPRTSPAHRKRENLAAERRSDHLERLGVSIPADADSQDDELGAAVTYELAGDDSGAAAAAARLMRALRSDYAR